jgi:hypothetical protein
MLKIAPYVHENIHICQINHDKQSISFQDQLEHRLLNVNTSPKDHFKHPIVIIFQIVLR